MFYTEHTRKTTSDMLMIISVTGARTCHTMTTGLNKWNLRKSPRMKPAVQYEEISGSRKDASEDVRTCHRSDCRHLKQIDMNKAKNQ